MLLLRSSASEHWYQEALRRAQSIGLDEESNSQRYWAYVSAVYNKLQSRPTHVLRKEQTSALREFMLKAASEEGQQEILLEKLAELEHEQWMQWTQTIAKRGMVPDEQVDKWRANWKPYSALSEEVKEQDRVWARKAMNAMNKSQSKSGPQPFAPQKMKLDDMSAPPMLDSRALFQRPDMPKPFTGRVIAVGRDGCQVKDDRGRVHMVRHEHVMDHKPPLTERDWKKTSSALKKMGYNVATVKPRKKGEKGKPTVVRTSSKARQDGSRLKSKTVYEYVAKSQNVDRIKEIQQHLEDMDNAHRSELAMHMHESHGGAVRLAADPENDEAAYHLDSARHWLRHNTEIAKITGPTKNA